MPGLATLIVAFVFCQSPPSAPAGVPAAAVERPTETLVCCLPRDAVAVLLVDRLAEHLDAWKNSEVWRRFQELPSYKTWLASPDHAQLERSLAMAEGLLGLRPRQALDAILGEAVVLSLHPDDQRDGGYAGLVLIRVRDVELLRKLVKRIETLNLAGGPPWQVQERQQGELTYKVRLGQGGAPSDAFALLEDGRFAWSNSEAVIRAFLRRAGGEERTELPDWILQNRQALPPGCFVEAHVHGRLWSEPGQAVERPDPSGREPVAGRNDALSVRLQRWVHACQGLGLGVAVAKEGGLALRLVERFPASMGEDSPLAVFTAAPDLPETDDRERPPPHRLAQAALSFDGGPFAVLMLDAASELAPERRESLEFLVSGILGEPEALRSLLSRLGSTARVRLNSADPRHAGGLLERGLDLQVALEFQQRSGTADQLRRLVQTLFALVAFDARREGGLRPVRVEPASGATLLVLALADSSLTVRIGRRWCVVGSAEGPVASWSESLEASPPAEGAGTSVKAAAELFAGPLRAWLDADRDHWIRESSHANGVPPGQAAREFDQALDLLSVLEQVRLVVRVSRDGSLFTQELTIVPAKAR